MDTTRHIGTLAIVTGAASGIGRATALRMAVEGATIVATDVDGAGLATLASEAPDIVAVAGDLTDAAFADELVARAEEVGPVTCVANVAGVMDHFVPAGEVDDAAWHRVFEINVTAPMRIIRAALGPMTERGTGSIVNVASAAGLGGGAAGAAYTSSKHAVIGLTKHVAFLYAPRGIRCNAVCPGGVRTGIGPTANPTVQWAFERSSKALAAAGPMAQPDEIAASISWLASAEASNVNGATLSVDGGWRSA